MQTKQITFPLDNQQFLNVIYNSFAEFIASGGSSRSTKKLKPLHGAIAKAIHDLLLSNDPNNRYNLFAQGFGCDREMYIPGILYVKKVDITITKNNNIAVAGIAVKFVMQNYSQNSVNYFENMLGETANIRCNNCPYFQIFIVLDKMPYYDTDKNIKKWETFTEDHIKRYLSLNNYDHMHCLLIPNKTLIYIVKLPPIIDKEQVKTQTEYLKYYKEQENFDLIAVSPHPDIPVSPHPDIPVYLHPVFYKHNNVIVNDFELFLNEVANTIIANTIIF